MPKYIAKCTECADIYEITMKIAEMEQGFPDCQKCGSKVEQVLNINFSLSGSVTFDGTPRISGGSGKKEESAIPINIWTPLPDGGMNLTRIGKKSDIDNSMP